MYIWKCVCDLCYTLSSQKVFQKSKFVHETFISNNNNEMAVNCIYVTLQ